jgi:hypothetical protein
MTGVKEIGVNKEKSNTLLNSHPSSSKSKKNSHYSESKNYLLTQALPVKRYLLLGEFQREDHRSFL